MPVAMSVLLAFASLALLAGCDSRQQAVRLQGGTMGTSWHVTYMPAADTRVQDEVQAGIQAELDAVNASMSTYREDSEISRFNLAPVAEPQAVSAGFFEVLLAALAVGEGSDGAYDVTVGPLVQRWGFGSSGGPGELPDQEEIETIRKNVGQRFLEVDETTGRVTRLRPVELDFSSLAKGYGVDRVAEYLQGQGIGNYMVEVGGELRVAGLSPRGDAWRIAVERPEAGSGVAAALALTAGAVATSGDYRNYFERGGRRYSHSIDPRTGQPVEHNLVSVSVLHDSAMLADAWATALTVLGPEEGMAVAQREGLAVYFIHRDGDDLVASHTQAFAAVLIDVDVAAVPGETL